MTNRLQNRKYSICRAAPAFCPSHGHLLMIRKILVLDEATANIDTETETLITQALARLMDGRTTIMVAHRLSTIQHADKIIVMHHGEIKESGTHQELLVKDGLYKKLYELQLMD